MFVVHSRVRDEDDLPRFPGSTSAGSGWDIQYNDHSIVYQLIDNNSSIAPNGGIGSFGFMLDNFNAPTEGLVEGYGMGNELGTIQFPDAYAVVPEPESMACALRTEPVLNATAVNIDVGTDRFDYYAPGLTCRFARCEG